jgi:KRAB domain-containing zinc finger protein
VSIPILQQAFILHMKAVHWKLLDFACPDCAYKTSSKARLKAHATAVHRTDKSYRCQHCDFTSAWSHYVRQHVKSVHAGAAID